MDKMNNRGRIIFILLIFVTFFVGFSIGKEAGRQKTEDRIQKVYRQGESAGYERGLNVPRLISHTQKSLQGLGFYKGKIDGIWGKLTDRAYCDWCAEQYFQ